MSKETKEQLLKDLAKAKKNPETRCAHCKKLALGPPQDDLLYYCTNCKFCQPIKTNVPLWWSHCKKCHAKIVTTKDGNTLHACKSSDV